MERDCPRYGEIIETVKFQSTRSAWSATGTVNDRRHHALDFNPRAPHGARHGENGLFPCAGAISIHALRMERDDAGYINLAYLSGFQSTRSAWSATVCPMPYPRGYFISIHALRMERDRLLRRLRLDDGISIHALRMERDCVFGRRGVFLLHFNPRAPHGARPWLSRSSLSSHQFQSTRSAWSATTTLSPSEQATLFQSTRSAWSATRAPMPQRGGASHLNPRAPIGARLPAFSLLMTGYPFQSTRSAWSATVCSAL